MKNFQNQKTIKMKHLLIFTFALSILSFSSCKKNDDDEEKEKKEDTTSLKLMYQHVFNGMDNNFDLNQDYVTEIGDTINATKLAFFVSNIKLTKSDGSILTEPDSYHIVEKKEGEVMSTFDIPNIPVGTYTKLEYSIGVDALANSSIDHQVGDLLPSNNPSMLWSWDTGYKFLSLEGNYRSRNHNKKVSKVSEQPITSGSFVYHIGKDVNYKTFNLELPDVNLNTSTENKLHFMVDVSQVFKNPTTIDIEQYSSVMGGDKSETIADNYATNMIMLHHAE